MDLGIEKVTMNDQLNDVSIAAIRRAVTLSRPEDLERAVHDAVERAAKEQHYQEDLRIQVAEDPEQS